MLKIQFEKHNKMTTYVWAISQYVLALNQEAPTVHFIKLPTIAPFRAFSSKTFFMELGPVRPCVGKHRRYSFGTLITINTVTAPNVHVFNF